MGFKEEASVPNYDWIIEIGPLGIGWTVEESPDLSIYNWDTGVAVYRHALMKRRHEPLLRFDIAGRGIWSKCSAVYTWVL